MKSTTESRIAEALRAAAIPLAADDGYAALLGLIGDARLVLLGEASHGTHEFYRDHARVTRLPITRKGFDAVAAEADWPDAYRLNRYVRGLEPDAFAVDALAGFQRFPTWMWRNTDVVNFIDWQRAHKDSQPTGRKTGFYGLDLYSLHSSMAAVLQHLDKSDPGAARWVRDRYACFDRFGDDGQIYGLLTGMRGVEGCQDDVIAALVDMGRRASAAAGTDPTDAEQAFDAEQNARLVKNAEAYYRSMYLRNVSTWNLRDRHMAETLGALEAHLQRQLGRPPRLVVWAHNSHLGDARATEMGEHRGELNLGQLVRERHGPDAVLVGFSTHCGSVTASDWDAPAERKQVLPSRPDSHEYLMHATGLERFVLPLRGGGRHVQVLAEPRLEWAIGVIYRPDTERQSHFHARLPEQFDALIHIDTTRAVEPLERGAHRDHLDAPETYPAGV